MPATPAPGRVGDVHRQNLALVLAGIQGNGWATRVTASAKEHHGPARMKTLLQLEQRPTAIFAASDSIALGVLAEARRQKIRIPEDISVVGFDGTYQAEESVPPLTSVSQPLQEMGRAALRFVLRQMARKPVRKHGQDRSGASPFPTASIQSTASSEK